MQIKHVKHEFKAQLNSAQPKLLYYFTETDGIVRKVWRVMAHDLALLCRDLEISPRNKKRETDMPIFRFKESV
jgi:hypothetical protein